MTQTKKFSQFNGPDPIQAGDIVVGLRNGPDGLDNWQFTGVGGGGAVTEIINQDTTGLKVGDWVSYSQSLGYYVPGLADSPEHAEISGVVLNIIVNATNGSFTLQQAGYIPSGTPGFDGPFDVSGVYFLSAITPGAQDINEPTINGNVRLPVFRADSTTSGWVIDLKTGIIVGTPSPIPPGGGGGTGVTTIINQDTRGLSVGQWVSYSVGAGFYIPAIATTPETAEVSGVVLNIIVNGAMGSFTLQQAGYIPAGTPGFSGFSTTGVYFLSESVAGEQSLTEPVVNGHVRLPVFRADSADSGWVLDLKTGVVIGTPAPIPPDGGGGDGTNIVEVNQTNDFELGDWLYVSGNGIYSRASALTLAQSQSVGAVIVAGSPIFKLQFSGYNTNTFANAVNSIGNTIAVASATTYYLSEVVTAAGKMCPTPPLLATSYSKPVFTCESSTRLTGYILPQRTLPLYVTKAGASPYIFLGTLNSGNNFASTNILVGPNGETYNSYFILIQTPTHHAGTGLAGIFGTAVGNSAATIQMYYPGFGFNNGNCSYYLQGVNNVAGNTTATMWADVNALGLYDGLVLLPAFTNKPVIESGYMYLHNFTEAGHSVINMEINTICGDQSNPPSPKAYTSIGWNGSDAPGKGLATGFRVNFNNGGSIIPGSNTYIVVYGIPNS
jgi:hypothetical protein